MKKIIPITFVFILLNGCNTATTTTTTITVSYQFDRAISTAAKRAKSWSKPAKPDGTIQGTITGDRTHPSYLIGEVHKADDADPPKRFVFAIRSPGHSGTETLTFDGVTVQGKTLTAHYTKKSPEVNTDDFRQMTDVIDITLQ